MSSESVAKEHAWIASSNSDSVSTEIARTLLREIQRLEKLIASTGPS